MQRFTILLYFALTHLIALLLFAHGFLLTRISLDDISERTESTVASATFSKAVILVIDALRHDFVLPQNATSPYWNHFTSLSQKARERPNNAFLTKFIADPPTTTLQRLKGLTTGSLPTFIDASSNFAGEAITEDNLLLQMRRAGVRIAFTGDDTWQALFPNTFEKDLNYPYESLNVWDLDTVDDGVYEHLFTADDAFFHSETRSKWDVVIAHVLGIDHAGHRYGPDHSETTRKLKQMDSLVEKLMQSVDDETILIVMGDHGMNTQGDHGGDSADELEAALFMYARQPVFAASNTHQAEGVAQINLVSTFALLFGLPIPYNNLGSPISEAFTNNHIMSYREAVTKTTAQMNRYIQTYETHSSSIKHGLAHLRDNEIQDQHWQTDVLGVFRYHWAQYDSASITVGLALMLTSLVLAVTVHTKVSKSLSYGLALTYSCLLFVACFTMRQIFSTLYTSTGMLSSLTLFLLFNFATRKSAWFDTRQPHRIFSLKSSPAVLALILHASIFASNSFTIHEDRISLFLLAILTIYQITTRIKDIGNALTWPLSGIACLLLSRSISAIRYCREEQSTACETNFDKLSPVVSGTLFLLALACNVHIIRRMFLVHRNDTATASWWWSLTFFLPNLLVCAFWYSNSTTLWPEVKLWTARFVIFGSIGQSLFWIWLTLPISFLLHRGYLTAHGLQGVVETSYLQFLLPASTLLIFLGKSVGSLSLLVLILQLLLLVAARRDETAYRHNSDHFTSVMILAELGFLHFFSSGHQMALPFIQWDLAFLVSKTIQYPLSPLLITGNAFASFIIIALWSPLLSPGSTPVSHFIKFPEKDANSPASSSMTEEHVTGTSIALSFVFATVTFSTMFFAAHFRRHLMVWKIFAPRFMCASLILLLVDVSLLLASIILKIRNHKISRLARILTAGI